MTRFSIFSKASRFDDATAKVNVKYRSGISRDQIVDDLSGEFQPKELIRLLDAYDNKLITRDFENDKLSIKYILWLFLIVRFFDILIGIISFGAGIIFALILIVVGPVLNIFSLYLYKKDFAAGYHLLSLFFLWSAVNSLQGFKEFTLNADPFLLGYYVLIGFIIFLGILFFFKTRKIYKTMTSDEYLIKESLNRQGIAINGF